MMSAAEVAAALDDDQANLRDTRVRASIQAFRVARPTPIRLAWDYGEPGEAFDGWLVFDDPGRRTGIVYCPRGFGPKSPWGLITTGETCPSMGMDSGWFGRFMDAYMDSFSATDLPIWRVVRWTKGDRSRESITEELSWEDAWKIVNRLRGEDPVHAFSCEHNIAY
jgi:hypothetical protein